MRTAVVASLLNIILYVIYRNFMTKNEAAIAVIDFAMTSSGAIGAALFAWCFFRVARAYRNIEN